MRRTEGGALSLSSRSGGISRGLGRNLQERNVQDRAGSCQEPVLVLRVQGSEFFLFFFFSQEKHAVAGSLIASHYPCQSDGIAVPVDLF